MRRSNLILVLILVRFFNILLLLVSLSSCASYRPLPLSNANIQQQLRTPALKALQVAAAQLHHPLLAPVPLNLRSGIGPDQAAILAVILNPNCTRSAVAKSDGTSLEDHGSKWLSDIWPKFSSQVHSVPWQVRLPAG